MVVEVIEQMGVLSLSFTAVLLILGGFIHLRASVSGNLVWVTVLTGLGSRCCSDQSEDNVATCEVDDAYDGGLRTWKAKFD